jgi:hypothetical protein
MNPSNVVGTLGRLLHILCRSLPMYLEDAKPWTRRDDQPAQRALANLVADAQTFSLRVAQAILELRGQPNAGRFPTSFTAVNDLSLSFLMPRVVQSQRRDVATIEQCVAELASVPLVRPLAEEILGNARGHLDILEGLMAGERAGRA